MGELPIEIAAEVFKAFFEFTSFTLFERRAGEAWRVGELGRMAEAFCVLTLAAFSLAAICYGLALKVAPTAIALACVSMATSLVLEAILIESSMGRQMRIFEARTLGDDPGWVASATPMALWIAVIAHREWSADLAASSAAGIGGLLFIAVCVWTSRRFRSASGSG